MNCHDLKFVDRKFQKKGALARLSQNHINPGF